MPCNETNPPKKNPCVKPCDCTETPYTGPVMNPVETNDCGTCGGVNTQWKLENFYRANIVDAIPAKKMPPFDVRVTELPYGERGLATLDGGTENEEVVEYEYNQGITYQMINGVNTPSYINKPGTPGTIKILKRAIHPRAVNLLYNGNMGNTVVVTINNVPTEFQADYNNCEFARDHLPNSRIERNITAQEMSVFTQYTCCTPASKDKLGIVALTQPPTNPNFPIAVGANDFANCNNNPGILAGLTKCVPDGQEIAVSWNDYATQNRAGLVKVGAETTVDCNGNVTTVRNPDGNTPEMALNALQRAYPGIYGTVELSRCHPTSRAVAKNDNATNTNNGLVTLKVRNDPLNLLNDDAGNIDVPAEVVQKGDFASNTNLALTYISTPNSPCITPAQSATPLALHKYDYATTTNPGASLLSRVACNPCKPIAVGDNDQRLFTPYIRMVDIDIGGPSIIITTNASGTTEVEFMRFETNITNTPAIDCNVKNSLYYGLNKTVNDLSKPGVNKPYSRIVIPKDGMYHVYFQVRMYIDPNIDSNYPFGNARGRVMLQRGTAIAFSLIGEKREWIHRSFKRDLVNLVGGSWILPGNESVNGVDVASDSFLSGAGLIYLLEGDEVYVTIDVDGAPTDYMYYRQRLEVVYIDDTLIYSP